MSNCCGAPILVHYDGLECAKCHKPCSIDYSKEYVIRKKIEGDCITHFDCDANGKLDYTSYDKNDILNRQCGLCSKYLI